MLTLYSDRRYLPLHMPPASILYPFWPDLHQTQLRSWVSPYQRYLEEGNQFFRFTSNLEEADLAILPMDWGSIRGDTWRTGLDRPAHHLAQAFAEKVRDANKPLVAFFSSDCSDEKIDLGLGNHPSKIFRQSAYRSRHRSDPQNEVMPFFCEDYIQSLFHGQLPLRDKKQSQNPTLSFCGFARPLNLKRRLQTVGYKGYMLATQHRLATSIYKGQDLRHKVLSQLHQQSYGNHHEQNQLQDRGQVSTSIRTHFIIREQAVFFQAANQTEKEKTRNEFLENMINSDYIFCCRGAANYSNRFYEALACGRVPVLLDTDCQLPYESLIDWDKYCIRVQEQSTAEKTAQEIIKRILNFHNSKSSEEFKMIQQDCHRLWKDWLSPEGFYGHLSRSFSRAISASDISVHYQY